MKKNVYFYRVCSWLKYHLTAWNTGGEGVHSPYLFEWVRMVMTDKHMYYVWDEIEAIREAMLLDTRKVEYVDYGSGGGLRGLENGRNSSYGVGARDERIIKDIAKGSLAKAKYAQMLFRLVNWLGASYGVEDGNRKAYDLGFVGLNIVELGTSLGVTTAYLAAVDSRNRVVSCEGCAAVANVAEENWDRLGLKNVECYVGELTDERLQMVVDGLQGKVDVAFVDANHTYAATLRFFDVLASSVHEKSVIVVDDIRYDEEMARAWEEICSDERVTSTMDLGQMGLVFFDKRYWRRNYRMRL